MKNLLKVLLLSNIFLLSGCSLYDAYMMADYDTGEYYLVNTVRTEAQKSIHNCSNQKEIVESLDNLYSTSLALKNYTQHIPDNEDAYELATKLNGLVADTVKFYEDKDGKVSAYFCKKKLQIIAESAENIQQAYGSKPR